MFSVTNYNIEYLEEIERVENLFDKQTRDALTWHFNVALAVSDELHTVFGLCVDTSAVPVVNCLVRQGTVKYDWQEYIVHVIVLKPDKTILESLQIKIY